MSLKKYQEILKRHSYIMQYSESACQDEWREIDEYRRELKLAEKDVIIDKYRVELGNAYNEIDDLGTEVAEKDVLIKELQNKLKAKEEK